MKKDTSSSIGDEVESRINLAYSTVLSIWKRSLELQVDLSNRLQSTKAVTKKSIDRLENELLTMLSNLRDHYRRIDPLLKLADQRYTIFSELENRLEHYLESLRFLPKDKEAFLGETGHKNTRYTFMDLAYIPACRSFVTVNGERMLLLSPLANLLQEYLENVAATYSKDQVDYLISERVNRERAYVLQSNPGALLDRVAKPKKQRTRESIEKEKDYLFLLDQYEKWRVKHIEETQRKRFNPKDWLQSRNKWSNKTEMLFLKHAEENLDDETEIARIIRYAQKMKRESDRNNE
jgi:hypothetical protein